MKRGREPITAPLATPPYLRANSSTTAASWLSSFTQALPEAMGTKRDFKLIVPRTEYHCVRCGGHQGHVFNDGLEAHGAALVQ